MPKKMPKGFKEMMGEMRSGKDKSVDEQKPPKKTKKPKKKK